MVINEVSLDIIDVYFGIIYVYLDVIDVQFYHFNCVQDEDDNKKETRVANNLNDTEDFKEIEKPKEIEESIDNEDKAVQPGAEVEREKNQIEKVQ